MDENYKAGEKGYDNQIDTKEDKKAVDDTISRKGAAAGVAVAPDVGLVEVLVHNYSLVSHSNHSLVGNSSVGEVESSGGH